MTLDESITPDLLWDYVQGLLYKNMKQLVDAHPV